MVFWVLRNVSSCFVVFFVFGFLVMILLVFLVLVVSVGMLRFKSVLVNVFMVIVWCGIGVGLVFIWCIWLV